MLGSLGLTWAIRCFSSQPFEKDVVEPVHELLPDPRMRREANRAHLRSAVLEFGRLPTTGGLSTPSSSAGNNSTAASVPSADESVEEGFMVVHDFLLPVGSLGHEGLAHE